MTDGGLSNSTHRSGSDSRPESNHTERQSPVHQREHDVLILAYDGIQALDLTGPHEVFASANRVADGLGRTGTRYRLRVVGPSGLHVTTESGLRLGVEPLPDPTEPIGTLLIPGGDSALTVDAADPVVVWASQAGGHADRLACVCTGAFVAAQAGLLGGRRVSTHWARANRLARLHPDLTVDGDAIYIQDGTVWSSAGVTAGIDLALAMVENDLGIEVAQEVARWLVVFLRRPGGQTQFAPAVWSKRSPDGPIRKAQDLIDLDPAGVGSVAQLASAVGLSARHFARRFQTEIGVSPARYLEQIRVTAARQHLETTDDSLAVIAGRCGFGTAETLRRVFHRRLSVSPDDYRRRFAIQTST